MLEGMRRAGGRAYALAGAGIGAVTLLSLVYVAGLLWGVLRGKVALTPELTSPLTWAVIVIGALGGAQVVPNVVERLGRGPPPPEP